MKPAIYVVEQSKGRVERKAPRRQEAGLGALGKVSQAGSQRSGTHTHPPWGCPKASA